MWPLLECLSHLITTFTTSDIDNNLCVSPFGKLVQSHSFSSSEASWNSTCSTFCLRHESINDSLSSNKRGVHPNTIFEWATHSDRSPLHHHDFMDITMLVLYFADGFIDCILTLIDQFNEFTLYSQRNENFGGDDSSLRHLANDVAWFYFVAYFC